MNHAPKTANATFCATLCDQLWANGLRAAFVAPGSRSTPLALALVAHPDIAVAVFHDERSAAFGALGHAVSTGMPGLVLCSSGTAGAHFYAAVIEADASAVPMIVCTADRPPELWGRGAPQTIDQTKLYGDKVRDFVEPGPPEDTDPSLWRGLANRLWQSATGARPGPVHANLSFRDPLTGIAGELPAPLAVVEPATAASPEPTLVRAVSDVLVGEMLSSGYRPKRGVLIVGRHQSSPDDLVAIANHLGWPIISDHRSGCRGATEAIQYFDALLREPAFADQHFPDVVLRVGEIVASKSTSQWLSRCQAHAISSRPHGRNIDPESIAAVQFDEAGFVRALVDQLPAQSRATDRAWLTSWKDADSVAADIVTEAMDPANPTSEVSVAANALASLPDGASVVVSSSMPVRDVEWFAGRRSVMVHANRGANGIDGVIATAIGVALTGAPTACLIGDVAFLHDSSSLTALKDRDVDLTIFVIDNNGGGIFSFLPQHELLDTETFERLFGTPHDTDIAMLCAAHGLEVTQWSDYLAEPGYPAGVRVVIARTNRQQNLTIHNDINIAIGAAVRANDS